MSTAYLKLCDLCSAPLEGEMRGERRKEKSYNGLLIEVGYSIGGWGRRANHINFSGEVCTDCYDYVMDAVRRVQNAVADRRDRPNHADRQAKLTR